MRIRDVLYKEIAPGWSFLLPVVRPRLAYRKHLLLVLTQIEAIVRTNSPLPEGLLRYSLDAPNARDRHVLRRLSERLTGGTALADAMQAPEIRFPAYVSDEVRAGEATGRLGDALASIIEGLNSESESTTGFRYNAFYFAGLVFSAVSILTFLAVKVLPVFVEIVIEFEQPVPRTTQAIFVFSKALDTNGLTILLSAVLVVAGVITLRALYRFGPIQSVMVRLIFCIPFLRRFYRNTRVGRLSRLLELRLSAGIPLPQALRETAGGGFPRPYRRALEACAADVEKGSTLASPISSRTWLFGRELPELVRLGQSREDLAWSFREARAHCTRENRRATRVWTEAMVPIGVGICALGVGTAAIGVFEVFTVLAQGIIADI